MSEDKEKIEVLEESKPQPKAKPRVDPELRERIARMEKEKREEMTKKAEKIAPKKSAKKADVPKGVTFKIWWVEVSKKLNLKPYLKEIVWADFKSRGLGEREPKEKYDQAMKMFGYKV